jgi:hypothetical protein
MRQQNYLLVLLIKKCVIMTLFTAVRCLSALFPTVRGTAPVPPLHIQHQGELFILCWLCSVRYIASHCCVAECDTVNFGRNLLVFRRNVLLLPSNFHHLPCRYREYFVPKPQNIYQTAWRHITGDNKCRSRVFLEIYSDLHWFQTICKGYD